MYHENRQSAGRTEMYKQYYSNRTKSGSGEKRKKKENETVESQKEGNRRRAEYKLTGLMNHNFSEQDLYTTLTFAKENRTGDEKKFKDLVNKFFRKLRAYAKKNNINLKYIWAAERGERGAEHIHMIHTYISPIELKKMWEHGWVDVKPLDQSGNYHKLAAYFIKYSTKTRKTENRLSGKCYNPSRNLEQPPKERKRISRKNNFDKNKINVPEGWYIDRDTVVSGINSAGYEYLTYTLVLLPGYERARKGSLKCQKKKR